MTKKVITLVSVMALAAIMALALAGCGGGNASSSSSSSAATSSAAKSNGLRFVTGGESGTYYAFGSVIAQHATNDAGVAITPASSGGSQANIQEIEDGTAELGFAQSDVMTYAYQGKNLFEKGAVTNFSVLAPLYQEQVQIVTCNPDIKTVADLKGKNVSIGAAGSGVYFNAIDILGVYGLSEKDITATYQSFADSADSLKDGKIDAAFIVAGAPTTAIVDLSTSKQAYLVALDQEHIDKLVANNPFYSPATIKAGTYKGIDNDVLTVGLDAVIVVSDKVSADDVYKITADIFENAPALLDNHAKYGEISIDKGASATSVPYHPGAAKYFKEKGFDVPTK